MNVDLAQELLNELGASLENLETQHAALFQFLRDKGILTDDQITPYLEEAGKASSVRWRAAHIRLESLFRIERQKEEELRENGLRQAGAGHVPLGQNKEPEAETHNEAGSAKAAPPNEEAETDGAVEGAGKQPASNSNDAQDEHATRADKKPSPNPQVTK
jgi:hypothetical protein